MMLLMVKEADLDRIHVPDDYEVLDATALGRRLGFKRHTVLAHGQKAVGARYAAEVSSREVGPIWYEKSVKDWERKEEERAHGK